MSRHVCLFLAAITAITGCKKGAEEACISACEAAEGYRDSCDVPKADCAETCEVAMKELEGEDCEDEQTDFFDCMAGMSYSGVECSEDALVNAILSQCEAEAVEADECAS